MLSLNFWHSLFYEIMMTDDSWNLFPSLEKLKIGNPLLPPKNFFLKLVHKSKALRTTDVKMRTKILMPAPRGPGNTGMVPSLMEDPSVHLETRGSMPKTQAVCILLRVQHLDFYNSGCKKYKSQHRQVIKMYLWCKNSLS